MARCFCGVGQNREVSIASCKHPAGHPSQLQPVSEAGVQIQRHSSMGCRWSQLQQMQLVLTDEAREAVTTAAGARRGCTSAPRPVNYRSWDEDDDSADCSAVTGHKGPMLDVSAVAVGRRMQVTLRWPEEMARGDDGASSLAHVCNQELVPGQKVRRWLEPICLSVQGASSVSKSAPSVHGDGFCSTGFICAGMVCLCRQDQDAEARVTHSGPVLNGTV